MSAAVSIPPKRTAPAYAHPVLMLCTIATAAVADSRAVRCDEPPLVEPLRTLPAFRLTHEFSSAAPVLMRNEQGDDGPFLLQLLTRVKAVAGPAPVHCYYRFNPVTAQFISVEESCWEQAVGPIIDPAARANRLPVTQFAVQRQPARVAASAAPSNRWSTVVTASAEYQAGYVPPFVERRFRGPLLQQLYRDGAVVGSPLQLSFEEGAGVSQVLWTQDESWIMCFDSSHEYVAFVPVVERRETSAGGLDDAQAGLTGEPIAPVTLESGLAVNGFGSLTTQTRASDFADGRNHSSIGDDGVANVVWPWIVDVERDRGDLRLR